ncbi:MAG: flagellar FliJ family protein [Alphaproteobacteria bacterium]|nr:flagellar FliJ family protein [Alphaproteobacteria bacterium]
MKKLDSLIRLRQWQLDEKRRKVAELERLASRFRLEIEQLDEALKAEQDTVSRSGAAITGYGNYASTVLSRREKMQSSLAGIENEMVQAVEEVAAAFQEYKKVDLIRARQLRTAELRNKRKQQSAMDEAGLNLYRRASNT